MVSHRAWHTAQQSGDFRSRLRKSENVVDEEQSIGAFLIAKIFGHSQRGQGYAQPCPGWLGHLAVNQRCLGVLRIARLNHAGLGHFQPEIVAFARAFADSAEYRKSAVLLGHIVDQLHDDDSLTYARAAEQTNLSTFEKGLDKVNDLDSGFKHLRRCRLLVEQRRRTMNRQSLGVLDRSQLIDRLADDVHHTPQRASTYRHRDWTTLINRLHAAHHAVSSLHGHTTNPSFA